MMQGMSDQQMVRTTITLPKDLHEKLRILAVKQKKSLGEVVVSRVFGTEAKKAGFVEDDLVFFNRVAKKLKGTDLGEELRKDRDRDEK